MKPKRDIYKKIVYCEVCDAHAIIDSDEKSKSPCEHDFFTTQEFTFDEWEERLYLDSNLKDESCGNYVGWCKELDSLNIIVSRTYCAEAGRYNLSRVATGVHSNSDPFGKHPEWWENKEENITLDRVKEIIKENTKDV
jgi:hypothetical protein